MPFCRFLSLFVAFANELDKYAIYIKSMRVLETYLPEHFSTNIAQPLQYLGAKNNRIMKLNFIADS